jgi:flagellar protein FlbD
MIAVTRLDGTPMIVNTDLIAWVEYIPDTVIALVNGEKLIVREKPETLVERVKDFRRAVTGAWPRPQALSRPPIAVVDTPASGGDR